MGLAGPQGRVLPRSIGVVAISVPVIVMAGWVLDLRVLTSLHPQWPAMQPNTAVAFLLLGCSLWLSRPLDASRRGGRAATACAAAALGIGFVTLAEYGLRADLGIDRLLLDSRRSHAPFPGRMGPNTAFALVLLSTAVLLADARALRIRRAVGVLVTAASFIGLASVVGYIYGAVQLARVAPTVPQMALITALLVLLVSTGIVIRRRDSWLRQLLAGTGVGSRAGRRLLPFVIAVPVVVSLAGLEAEARGRISSELNSALMALATMVALGAGVLFSAHSLNAWEAGHAESERRYRSLFEGIPIGLLRTTPDGRILEANRAIVASFGYPDRDTFLATPVQNLYADPEERHRLVARLERDGTVRDHEARMRRFDGNLTWININANAVRAEDGRALYFEGSMRDITERRRSAEALQSSERRLSSILDAALDAVITMDETGAVQGWNPRAHTTFGWTAAEAIGRPLADLIIPGEHRDAHRRGLATFLATGQGPVIGRRIEITALNKDGKQFPVELAINALRVEHHWLFSAFVRDLSDRKRLESQFLQAQKMEAVGQLAGGIAHDFNNLLAAITVFTELATGEMAAGDPKRQDLDQVQEAAKRATALTRQLLAFSRQQVLQPVKVDPNEIVTNLGRLLGRLIGEDIELLPRLDPGAGLVLVDPGQLEQVIMNLVVNARDAMPSGGQLIIATGVTRARDPDAKAWGLPDEGEFVRISVTDTGTGMSPEVRRHVFEPFFTTKEHKGTGLGLATVYGIVRQSGGYISLTTEPGRGTTFTIHLPRVAGEADARVQAASAPPRRGTETILLAEDEHAVRQAAGLVLKRYGYAMLVARSGAEALEVAGRHAGPIHLLLTDVVMPGMDGRALLERLRATRPGLKALFMSGYAGDAVARRGVIESGGGYLQKPFNAATLAQKVRDVLDAPEAPLGKSSPVVS